MILFSDVGVDHCLGLLLLNWSVHTLDSARCAVGKMGCSESKGVVCCPYSDIMVENNLNGLQTTYSLILKLSHLNIIHQVFLVLIPIHFASKQG